MAPNLLIGQSKITEALASAVKSGRVAHAYLFFGPEGSGKRAAAIEFAASLLCANPQDGRACTACNACHRALKLGHPDLQLLMPSPKAKTAEDIAALVSDIAERVTMLAQDPYAVIDFERRPSLDAVDAVSNKQVIYSKDQIGEELRRTMSLSPVEGGYRIAILTDADRMRTEAANAFLKLLEEPGKRTLLVLTTNRPDRLLATIRSRCQMVRFSRLTDEEVASALVARAGVDEASAKTLARMAEGSLSHALSLQSNDLLSETRALVIEFLRSSYKHDSEEVIEYSDYLSRKGRESIKFFLALLLAWLRDLLLFRTIGEEAPVVNLDQTKEIRDFCANLPSARIESMIFLVEEAAHLTERNINLKLTFVVLSQALGEAMKGKAVSGLVESLSEEALSL